MNVCKVNEIMKTMFSCMDIPFYILVSSKQLVFSFHNKEFLLVNNGTTKDLRKYLTAGQTRTSKHIWVRKHYYGDRDVVIVFQWV